MSKIDLYDGKYTVIDELESGGGFRALRYGGEWRSLSGDNLVYAMYCEIERLRGHITKTESNCVICGEYFMPSFETDDALYYCGECKEETE